MKYRSKSKKTAHQTLLTSLRQPKISAVCDPIGLHQQDLPRDEEKSFRAIYENTPVMMHSIGSNQELVSVNRNWLEVMGYEEHEVIGRKSSGVLTEASRRHAIEVALPAFLKTGSARDVEYRLVKKDGEEIDVLLSAVADWDENGQFMCGYCYMLDVKEHRMSDQLWRQLSLVEERNLMSRNIHDTVEHSLIGIMLRTDTVEEFIDSDPIAARAELESVRALAKLGLEQARNSVWDLQPLKLTSNVLSDAISRGLSRLADEGMKTSLIVDGEEPQDIDQRNKLAVIRIVQETFNNIRIHSSAQFVKARLSYGSSHIDLLVTDDGVGFDIGATHSDMSPTSRGFGLANIRESALLAGGTVYLYSAMEEGTQVEVHIPFEHDPKRDLVLTERTADDDLPHLTNREPEVLRILSHRGRNKDIASEISVSLHTVKFHVGNLYDKLGFRTRAELVRVAIRRSLLTP